MKDHIPVNDGKAPEHYGYIPDTLNIDHGDEVDVIVFSDNPMRVGDSVDVEPIAVLKREDNDEKIVAVEFDSPITSWVEIEESRRDLVLRFYGSHHAITSVGDRAEAETYLNERKVKH